MNSTWIFEDNIFRKSKMHREQKKQKFNDVPLWNNSENMKKPKSSWILWIPRGISIFVWSEIRRHYEITKSEVSAMVHCEVITKTRKSGKSTWIFDFPAGNDFLYFWDATCEIWDPESVPGPKYSDLTKKVESGIQPYQWLFWDIPLKHLFKKIVNPSSATPAPFP